MNRKVFVTGGSRGIGAATVRKFREEGDDVFFVYRENDQAAKQVMEETGAIGIRCDVRDLEAVENAVKQGKIYFGINCFDVLVANAGVSVTGLFGDDKEEEQQELNVNFKGTANAVYAVLPDMIREKNGSIICVSSMWGIRGASSEVMYAASKSAIIGLVRSLAVEAGPSGIRVNAVAPGVILTDMCLDIDGQIMDVLKCETPLQRLGRPEDVAEGIWFLSGEKASFITGQVLSIDGGYTV